MRPATRWLISGLLLLYLAPAYGQFEPEDDAPNDTESSRPAPEMPTVEEAEQIVKTQTVVTYPRLAPIIQFGLAAFSSAELERSFDGVIDALGLEGSTVLDDQYTFFDFTMRVDINYRWRIAVEYAIGGGGSDVVDQFNRLSIIGMLALTSETARTASLSAGLGIGMSRLEVHRGYDIQINDYTYLQNIAWQTAWKPVVPVLVMIELPNLRYSRGAFVASAGYQIGGTDTGDLVFSFEEQDYTVPMEANLSGWFLSAGLAMGF